jgi:hypothetical protein
MSFSCCYHSSPIHAFGLPQGGGTPSAEELKFLEQLEKMSPEEQQAFAREVQTQIEAQVLQEVEKMTPEQQQFFYSTVDKLSHIPEDDLRRILSSEEETEKLLNNLLAEQNIAIPQPEMPQEITEEREMPTESEEETKAAPIAASAQEKIALLLQNISAAISDLTVKITGMPEIGTKVPQWGNKKAIVPWNAEWSWANLHHDLDKLRNQMALLLKKDASGTYIYFDALAAKEGLVGKLECLNARISPCIKCIHLSPMSLENVTTSLSPESKSALQKTIGFLADTLYVQKVSENIAEVIAKKDKELQKKQNRSSRAMESEDDFMLSHDPLSLSGNYAYKAKAPAQMERPSSPQERPESMHPASMGKAKRKGIESKPKPTIKEKKAPTSSSLPPELFSAVTNITNALDEVAGLIDIDTKDLDPLVAEFTLQQAEKKLAGKTANSIIEKIKALQMKLRGTMKEHAAQANKEILAAITRHEKLFGNYIKKAEKERAKNPTAATPVTAISDALTKITALVRQGKR